MIGVMCFISGFKTSGVRLSKPHTYFIFIREEQDNELIYALYTGHMEYINDKII